MSLCYDFSKWTMITLASVAISLTVGLLMKYAHGQENNKPKDQIQASKFVEAIINREIKSWKKRNE